MSRKNSDRYSFLRTIRMSPAENQRLLEYAEISGITVSEYIRRKCFGGRPITAYTDLATIRELRRLGGRRKHNIETVREGGCDPCIADEMEDTLVTIKRTIECLGVRASEEAKPILNVEGRR